MKQQPNFVNPSKSDHAFLIHKSLYWLKQAPNTWFDQLFSSFFILVYHNAITYSSLFVYHNAITVLLPIYVDDIIVTGSNASFISNLIHHLSSEFAIKDLASLHNFLGVEIRV